MYFIATIYSLLIACNWISAITVSPISRANKTNENRAAIGHVELAETRYKSENSAERMRRLIPYMTFYIPTNHNGGYNIPDDYGYKQLLAQKPNVYKQSAVENYGQQFYYNGASTTTIQPPLLKHQPPLSVYVHEKNNNKYVNNVTQLHAILLTRRPQSPTNNKYTDFIIPQRLAQNNNFYSIKNQPINQPSSQNNDHNLITPFLPSNQLPGSFRPILYETVPNQHDQHEQHRLSINTMLRQQTPLSSTSIAYQEPLQHANKPTQKPFYLLPVNPKPQKYATYLRPEPQYIQLVSTTVQPVPNNIEEPILIQVKHIPEKRPVVHNIYASQQQQQQPQQEEILSDEPPNSIRSEHFYSNINYDLDPDDGYASKVTPNSYRITKHRNNPNEQPYVKYNKVEFLPTTETPRVQQYTTKLPNYEYETIGGYISTSEKPYRDSVTTQDTRQHLTETTQIQQPIIDSYQPNINHQQQYYYDNVAVDYKNELNNVPTYNPVSVTHNSITENYTPLISNAKTKAALLNSIGNLNTTSLTKLLKKLQDSNHLPQTFTPDNVDQSVKTLVKTINNLRKSQKGTKLPTQTQQYSNNDEYVEEDNNNNSKPNEVLYNGALGPNSGKPGIDYPTLDVIPKTSFTCKDQRYKGFFGDPETNCQVWHYCDLNGGQASFLCPNGTIFNQVSLTCDWWFNVKCSSTAQLYVLNERLYKYILPFSPKFPEDYSGPLVDKYLAIKFQEMEDKMKREKNKNRVKDEPIEPVSTQIDGISSTIVKDAEASLIDDEGQSHNIDNAVQLPSSTTVDDTETNTEYERQYDEVTNGVDEPLPTIIISTESVGNGRDHDQLLMTSHPPLPPPRVEVESEQLEVIEIKSDGSSGHLTPGRDN